MEKIVFVLLFCAGVCSTAWSDPSSKDFDKNLSAVTYDQLRPRLLLIANTDIDQVEPHPEYIFPNGSAPKLYLTQYGQTEAKKQKLYRVIETSSFTAYTLNETEASNSGTEVYSISIEELNDQLEPTGTVIELGAKAAKTNTVIEFKQIPDKLSRAETLTTQRAQVGDHIINAFPVTLNGTPISTYSDFEVVGISKVRIPFTLTYDYTLHLKKLDDASSRTFEFKAPGYIQLNDWALVVAEKNIRSIKFGKIELVY